MYGNCPNCGQHVVEPEQANFCTKCGAEFLAPIFYWTYNCAWVRAENLPSGAWEESNGPFKTPMVVYPQLAG